MASRRVASRRVASRRAASRRAASRRAASRRAASRRVASRSKPPKHATGAKIDHCAYPGGLPDGESTLRWVPDGCDA
nr:hypothetical protein [Methylomarinum sp. Ch1-1]MDP4521176.1 hypothetical protein [Methylomarinum sp. Ch1-1]